MPKLVITIVNSIVRLLNSLTGMELVIALALHHDQLLQIIKEEKDVTGLVLLLSTYIPMITIAKLNVSSHTHQELKEEESIVTKCSLTVIHVLKANISIGTIHAKPLAVLH
jgi:hypothetical protein